MAGAFNFTGLFAIRGELAISRSIVQMSRWVVKTHGLEHFTLRMMNLVRKKFGLKSQGEAFALMTDIRENIDAANRLNLSSVDDIINASDFPESSNILGGTDGTDRYVVSGTAELVDDFGDFLRHVPFVVEGNDSLSKQQLLNMIGEDILGFIDKYHEELVELGGGGVHVAKITFSYTGSR